MSDSLVNNSENERNTSKSSLNKIPIPNDIKDEFSKFFNSSNNPDDYKFIFDLNQYNSVPIWKNSNCDMDKTEQRIPFEKPAGMKTIDHYFSKRSSLNKSFDSNIKENDKSSKQSKTVNESPVKSKNDEDVSKFIVSNPSKKHQNYADNILSQDIFDTNDSVSSNEYSVQNEEILGDCDVVPCTQVSKSITSKFNMSNFINSGSAANRSSDSESDCEKLNVTSVHKSSVTSEDSCNDYNVKRSKASSDSSSAISKSKNKMKGTDQLKTDKRNSNDNTKSPSKVNLSVNMNKPEYRKHSRSSSSSDEDNKSPSKANTLANSNNARQRQNSGNLSSSVEDSNSASKVNTSVIMNTSKQRKSSGSSSSRDEEGYSPSKANTSMKLNKPNDGNDSLSSSSSDEGSKFASKVNTLVHMNKSVPSKTSGSSSSSDEGMKSPSKANSSVNLNKSRKSSYSSSSSDEETESASAAKALENLNKSKNKNSNVSSSFSEEETKPPSKANTSVNLNESQNKNRRRDSYYSDEEDKYTSKANTSMNLNKSRNKESRSLSSDEKGKSVAKTSSSDKFNSSRGKDISESSSDDEGTRSAPRPSLKMLNLSQNKEISITKDKEISSSSSSDSENDVDIRNTVVERRKLESNSNSRNDSNSKNEHLKSKLSEKVKNNIELPKNILNKPSKKVNNGSSDSSDEESTTNKLAVIDKKLKSKSIGAVTLNKSDQSSSEETDSESRSSNINFQKSENKLRVKEHSHDYPSRKSMEQTEHLKHEISSLKGHKNNNSDGNSSNSKKNLDKMTSNSKCVKKQSDSDSSSDNDDEFNFKNKEIGKMLGINAIESTRNMSLSGQKVLKTFDKPVISDPRAKIPLKNNDKSCTEDSESDSSSSEDDEEIKKDVNLKTIDVLKDQSMLFAPSASSSFMGNSTPNPLSRNRMKMTAIESVQRDHKTKDSNILSEDSNNHEQTVLRNDKKSLKRKYSSDSDEESDKTNWEKSKFEENKNLKRKRSDSLSESTSPKKLKNEHQIPSDYKMNIDQPDSSSDEDNLKIMQQDWFKDIVKNKRQVVAEDKLKVEDSVCLEDITSEDEIYTLQCPKELNIESLVGKKISLTGESLFEGLTKDKRCLAFETFAVSLPSKINLLLPSKNDSTLKLGGFEVKGSIIVSERCLIPEVDMSTFSSTGRESSSDDELNVSTPLPSGLKLRHPLHGLNYKKTALPNFDAVISREKKRNKKKNKKHGEDETVEEMIDSLVAKKKLSLKDNSDEFKKPLAPKSKSRSCGSSTKDSDKESERGFVIGRNLISLVSDDEYRSSSKEDQRKKKKKKNKQDNTEIMVQQTEENEDSKHSKKKRIKDKLMDQMLREVECNVGVTSTLDVSEPDGSVTKKKKEKKKKRNKAEQEEHLEENSVPIEESQPEIKKKKKKEKKERH